MSSQNYKWWQTGVIYEIYPRSFMDGTGDGVGDLKGILDRFDHIRWLGVDAIWIGPFYPSPMADLGYDISDYKAVDPLFGTLEDFDTLVAKAHEHNIKVIIDFVPNHSSDKHPWFLESRSSRENPKADWYLWKDGQGSGPPNNWLSVFGGSAWQWDDSRKQFYYHAFLKEQPDLNLRNPEVQEAISDAMRFWLKRRVDGLRVDVMWHLYKDALWRNNPANPDWKEGQPDYDRVLPLYSTDHADVIRIVQKMRKVMDEFPERVMIGEMYLSIHQTVAYYGPNNSGAHLPGNFTLLLLPWNARRIAAAIYECESSMPEGAWPNWVLGNHDRPRLARRAGQSQSRVAAMMLLTLRGTPTIYNGDELGMQDVKVPKDEAHDPQGKMMNVNRDEYRSPIPWTRGKNGGFTTGKPWIRLPDNYRHINVEFQRSDPYSLLALYKKLLEVRKKYEALQTGYYIPIEAQGNVLAYKRENDRQRLLVILNLGDKPEVFSTNGFEIRGKVVVDSNLRKMGQPIEGEVRLGPDEGLLVELD